MLSLESPRRGDSNEYTQYTILIQKKKNTLNYPKSAAMRFCSKGLKKEFETAAVNEPSVFEPLKFYCIWTDLVPARAVVPLSRLETNVTRAETTTTACTLYTARKS